MEKTTKKKKSKKGLRKRIGIIAVGGLSLVLTVCLSVGATLAWFAGSTWSSKSLYMGGPVYVEMQGRGDTDHSWKGGDGNLDIQAAASRTGTVKNTPTDDDDKVNYADVLLPGQKVEIYSNARVYSTAETNTIADAATPNISSGASTGNTSNGTTTYRDESGRVTTTTTSVLRARFSIDIEFDPGNGFNNFTDYNYMYGYPKQSTDYKAAYKASEKGDTKNTDYSIEYAGTIVPTKLGWADALDSVWTASSGRRDGVSSTKTVDEKRVQVWTNKMGVADKTVSTAEKTDLQQIKDGTLKSIYQWKFVSAAEYYKAGKELTSATDNNTSTEADGHAKYGVRMAAPFDGNTKINGNGYYGVWVTEQVADSSDKKPGESGYTATYGYSESDAFYKARCNAYLNTYVEYYKNEYGNIVTRTVAQSVQALEDKLNEYFVKLVNDSSNAIHGKTTTGSGTTYKDKASWLYIDPSIGNDTNTDEISTGVGGWWYLVEDNGEDVGDVYTSSDSSIPSGSKVGDQKYSNKITTAIDAVGADGEKTGEITTTAGALTRAAASDKDETTGGKVSRLDAKLYEIKPNTKTGVVVSKNGDVDVEKVVSTVFPFVNGTFALPADALTNIFANAKLTFKISFQALQAFFPYTEAIDNMNYTNSLLGTAKALSIRNAIPIYNEAFDYQEVNGSSIANGEL